MNIETSRPRLPALTSLRFIAALLVVFFHFQAVGVTVGPEWFRSLSSIGYVGVSFFFVLSGFILVYTYGGRAPGPAAFWRARFARIYPAYAFSLLATAPVFFYVALKLDTPVFAWASAHLKPASVLVAVLLQAWVPPAALSWNPVAWSLSVEAFFYLAFPLLLASFSRRSRWQLFIIAAACSITSLALSSTYVWLKPDGIRNADADVVNAFWLDALKFFPVARLPEFLLGMACGFLFLRSRHSSKPAPWLVLAGLAGFALVVRFRPAIPYPILHTALLAPAFAAIVYGLALRPRWAAFLESKMLVLLGDASYSLYLLHSMAAGIFFHDMKGGLRHGSFSGAVVFLAAMLAISILVYRFIEEPARKKLRPKEKPQFGALGERPIQQMAG